MTKFLYSLSFFLPVSKSPLKIPSQSNNILFCLLKFFLYFLKIIFHLSSGVLLKMKVDFGYLLRKCKSDFDIYSTSWKYTWHLGLRLDLKTGFFQWVSQDVWKHLFLFTSALNWGKTIYFLLISFVVKNTLLFKMV